MSEKIKYVPLPEVGEHTDQIKIGELGLPVGLDTERLLLNLPRTLLIAKLGDIGHLTIRGFRGEVTEEGFGIGGISGDGTGTATKSITIAKAKASQSEVEGGDHENISFKDNYLWKDATVKINNAEIEQRIRSDGDKWERGPYDVKARAKYMNDSLRRGLASAALESILGENPLRTLELSSLKSTFLVSMYSLGLGPEAALLFFISIHSVENCIEQVVMKNKMGRDLPPRQISLFNRRHYDRLVLTSLLNRSSRLIKAKNNLIYIRLNSIGRGERTRTFDLRVPNAAR